MLNINFVLFCWILPSIPSPHRGRCPLEVFLSKMATNAPRYITNNEIELLSFLRQNVVRKLLEEVSRQNRDKRDPLVIAVVVQYFNLGPAPHGLFYNTVHQIAHSF